MSMAYHPQSNGQAEKANTTLDTFLKAYVLQLKFLEQWTWLLPLAEFMYNATKHRATGMSPFEADIGYVPKLPLDLLIPRPRTLVSKPGAEYADRLIKILRILRKRMEEIQLAMVSDANEHRQPHPFQIGNSRFLATRLLPEGYANLNPVSNNGVHLRKFQHPNAGPFNILKIAGENAVVLNIPAQWWLHAVFNVVQLKLSKVDQNQEHPPPLPLHSTTTVEYEVESILEYKGTTTQNLEYLVKWIGYTKPTLWEPLENFRGSSNDQLYKYHIANSLRRYHWMEG